MIERCATKASAWGYDLGVIPALAQLTMQVTFRTDRFSEEFPTRRACAEKKE